MELNHGRASLDLVLSGQALQLINPSFIDHRSAIYPAPTAELLNACPVRHSRGVEEGGGRTKAVAAEPPATAG